MQVVDGDATPSHAPLGLKRDTHVTSHDLNQLYESRYCSAWLQECATALSKVRVLMRMYPTIAVFIVTMVYNDCWVGGTQPYCILFMSVY